MSKFLISIAFSIFISSITLAQMPTVGGVWYIPATQSALLITWDNGKITKLQYAKGNGKFVNAILKSQGESDMGFKFSYSLPTAPAIVYEATQGFSPLAAFLSINTKGTYDSVDATQFDETANTSLYNTAAECMRFWLWHFKYINNDNQDEIIPDDAQEGATMNQLVLTYQHASGTQETAVATINPITHEVSFETPKLGKVHLKLQASGFDLLDNANNIKGSFSFKPSH